MKLKMQWDKLLSTQTTDEKNSIVHTYEQRSQFMRDYDRLCFSGPFRRLQNKTQVFPLPGPVFVHNRLTHSLEVSCVGRSLGNDISQSLTTRCPHISGTLLSAIGPIVSAACLAHDLGNPPFGHNGEQAISSYFKNGAGRDFQDRLTPAQWNDITHFDGNANTFRMLTHHFPGRIKGNFDLTYSTLASIVKYPYASELADDCSKFGFFCSDENSFRQIADSLGLIRLSDAPLRYARYPLVYLVEAADDICYQIMDIEDAFKLGILALPEVEEMLLDFLPLHLGQEYHTRVFRNNVTDGNSRVAFLRSEVINVLERSCAQCFLENEDQILSGTFSGTLVANLQPDLCRAYENCTRVAQETIYQFRDSVNISIAGCRIISELLHLFLTAVESSGSYSSSLLLRNIPSQYEVTSSCLYTRILAVLDYLSGMTDVYAVSLYQTISGTDFPIFQRNIV